MSVTVHHYSDAEQKRDIAARNAWFLKVNGREITYQDVLEKFARFTGGSQVESRRVPGCGEDSGVREQT